MKLLRKILAVSVILFAVNNSYGFFDGYFQQFGLDCEVVESKKFSYDGFEAAVALLKMKDATQPYRIWLDWEFGDIIGGMGLVKSLNHVNVDISDFMGHRGGNLNADVIFAENLDNLESSRSFSYPQVVSYVESLSKRYPGSVNENNVKESRIIEYDGWLTSRDKVDTNKLKNANAYPLNPASIIGSWEVQENGTTYKIYASDKDGNRDNFEEIFIESDGLPLQKVRELVGGLAQFGTLDNTIKDIDLYQINIEDGNKAHSSLLSKELWEMLLALYQHSKNNNSIEAFDSHHAYDFSETGKVKYSHRLDQ